MLHVETFNSGGSSVKGCKVFVYLFLTSERDVNQVKRGEPWAYQCAMILLNDYDDFYDIMVVSHA